MGPAPTTLAASLAAGRHDLRAVLRDALGDPGLELAYWIAGGEAWVDPSGRRMAVDEAAPGVTVVARKRGRVVALLHDPALDGELVESVVTTAALAFENEQLALALRLRLAEQDALRRVATLVARQHAPEEVFALVTHEVARHLDADAALTARYEAAGVARVIAEWSAPGVGHLPADRPIVIGGATALAQVQATLAPARADSYETMEGDYPAELRRLGIRASVAAPILVDGELWGAVAAASAGAPFPTHAERRLGAFAELVGQAIANVDARVKLTASRARIVEAADEARRRIERDLHDGAQQRLVGLALSLRLVARRAEPEIAAAIEACMQELQAALHELRELARGIHPTVLSERGLRPALEALAGRAPIPVEVDFAGDRRLPPAHEAALYFVAAEALTNVAKYARAGSGRVRLVFGEDWAEIAISDDGVGGARADRGSGLRGLADRLDALGGRLTVDSEPETGTTIRARVPVATDGRDPGPLEPAT